MDCDTTGIEPDYALVKYKKLAGGGVFRIVNRSLPLALKKLGYSQEEIEGIVAYCVGHGKLPQEGPLSRGALKDAGIGEDVLDGIEERLKASHSRGGAAPGSSFLSQGKGNPAGGHRGG
jgi:ribonucleoside-diphosphate reductase alpha chain